MRGQGSVYRPRVRGRQVAAWWLDYHVAGKRHREAAHTRVKSEALDLLRQRIDDRKSGKVVGRLEAGGYGQRITFSPDGTRYAVENFSTWEDTDGYVISDAVPWLPAKE